MDLNNINDLIYKVTNWINMNFSNFEVVRQDQIILNSTMYSWTITSEYLILIMAFDDFSFKFNGIISINAIDTVTKDYITEDIRHKSFEDFTKCVTEFMEEYNDVIEASKNISIGVSKNSIDDIEYIPSDMVIDFVNCIIQDENR